MLVSQDCFTVQNQEDMSVKNKHTYKEGDKHVLFGVIYRPLAILVFIVLLGHERQTGFIGVVVIEAAMQAAGWLVAVKAMFEITRMAAGEKQKERRYAQIDNVNKLCSAGLALGGVAQNLWGKTVKDGMNAWRTAAKKLVSSTRESGHHNISKIITTGLISTKRWCGMSQGRTH